MFFSPDYDKVTTVSENTPMQEKGFIRYWLTCFNNGVSIDFYVNSTLINTRDHYGSTGDIIPVSKGDIVTFRKSAYTNGWVYFMPYKK